MNRIVDATNSHAANARQMSAKLPAKMQNLLSIPDPESLSIQLTFGDTLDAYFIWEVT
jgi:hypothetical protein